MNANDMLPYGLGNPDLVEAQEGYFVDRAIVDDLNKLTEACRKAGFELRIESAYRPFEKQLSIWNSNCSTPTASPCSAPPTKKN